jgi:hypothetical protein
LNVPCANGSGVPNCPEGRIIIIIIIIIIIMESRDTNE